MTKQTNTTKKARLVQGLVREHYQPERQDRCKRWVYRNVVVKQYPMSERTFWRYLAVSAEEREVMKEDERQLRLF